MIKVENISKSYGEVEALQSVNFSVEKGELFGLIGPDGAGKSTLFRILTTLILPDSGNAFVNQNHTVTNYLNIRNEVGYMPGKFSLYQDLTVEENLQFFASIFKTTIQENYDLIKDIYQLLEPFKDRKAGKLSGGMKQKLALSCALIHKPKVLFLDEPTTGVDPVSRKEFWEMLKSLKQKEITILVSTPYMDEASLCDRVALINKGKILQIDTPKNITNRYPFALYNLESKYNYKVLKAFENFEFTKHIFAFGQSVHLSVDKNLDPKTIEDFATQQNLPIEKIQKIEPTIEDCFMNEMLLKIEQ